MPILAVIFPKYSWRRLLKETGTIIRWETHIDYKVLFNVLIGKDEGYRSQVYQNYNNALFERVLKLGNTNIEVNTFALVVILILSIILITGILYKKGIITQFQKVLYSVYLIAQLLIDVCGVGVIYMFNFKEDEAVGLASSSRYLNIVFLATTIPILIMLVKILENIEGIKTSLYLVFISVVIIFCPMESIHFELSRSSYKEAKEYRDMINPLAEKISRNTTSDDFVHIIYQMGGEQSGVRTVFNYASRPGKVSGSFSIGEPFFEGDVWTVTMDCEEWQRDYLPYVNYVALWYVNDYFIEHFKSAFYDQNKIVSGALYRVDHEDGLLYFVE